MKIVTKSIAILFLLAIITSCNKSANDNEQLERTTSTKEHSKNIDEDFNSFLEVFSKDSLFQISRVKFPFQQKEWIDPETGMVEKLIEKKFYDLHNFSYPKDALTREFDRYTQKIKVNKNTATIEIRGVDNGICADYIFEKINGKWMFIASSEQST